MEYTCVDSSSDQVVGCSDSMDVTSEVKVKLEEIKHISYLILLQFSFISFHRRQMERKVLIAMLKWVRVEGERLLSAVCGREERISLKQKNASPTFMSFYKLPERSFQIKRFFFPTRTVLTGSLTPEKTMVWHISFTFLLTHSHYLHNRFHTSIS